MLGSPTTTIKTDGKESDPYCFLSFIDFKANRNSDYAKYLQKVDMRLSTFFQTISDSGNKNCALVISERSGGIALLLAARAAISFANGLGK